MKSNHMFLLGVAVLAMAVVGERASARYEQRLASRLVALRQDAAELDVRIRTADVERKQYESMQSFARQVTNRLRSESDVTRLVQWLNETASQSDIAAATCRLLPTGSNTAVLDGAFERLRLETNGRGSYASILRYLERIEHAPTPMLVESLAITGDRAEPGVGAIKVTLSCLSIPPKPAVPESTGATK